MSRYIIFGGFLGAGKTTSMMALSRASGERGQKAVILVNDLGRKDLVDMEFTEAMGYAADMIHGGCICFQTEELLDHLRALRDQEHADIILSDIPGCGVGALEHVYHKLSKEYPGEVTLAPFTAVVDPIRLQRLIPDPVDIHMPEEMDFLFDQQLVEAELVLLNKMDLLTEEEGASMVAFLQEKYPHAKIIPTSAKTGQGMKEVLDYIMSVDSALPNPYFDLEGPEFAAAEEKLSWYDLQFDVRAEREFPGNDFITEFVDTIRAALASAGRNAPHLKVMAEDEKGELCKVSLLGIDQPLDVDLKFAESCRSLSVILNARVACESDRIQAISEEALRQTAEAYGLDLEITFTEGFGMMDEDEEE